MAGKESIARGSGSGSIESGEWGVSKTSSLLERVDLYVVSEYLIGMVSGWAGNVWNCRHSQS